MKELKDIYDRSGEEFLDELFHYEYCSYCGKDKEDHTPVPLFSDPATEAVTWFARCDKVDDEELKDLN